MSLLPIILYLYILICLTILYIILCGSAEFHKNGLIGRLNVIVRRWLCMDVAQQQQHHNDDNDTCDATQANSHASKSSRSASGIMPSCCPLFISKAYHRVETYLCYSKNPLMQLLYLGLLSTNACYFFYAVFFRMHQVPGIMYQVHYVFGPVVLLVALFSFLASSFSNPGIITKANIRNFQKVYEHNVCYPGDRICPTCKIPKPARSKHCPLTGHCVSRFDHFCPWLNNAVGEWNYRYFHLFLLSNCIMALYGTYLIVIYLWRVAERDQLWTARYMAPSGSPIDASPAIVLQYMLMQYMWLLAQIIFGICISMMLFLFWGYHFARMVVFNTTTNETFKMSEVEDWMEALRLDPQCFDDEWDDLLPFQRYQVKELKRMIAKEESLSNPYYISLWENIREVLAPPSLRNYRESKFSKDAKVE